MKKFTESFDDDDEMKMFEKGEETGPLEYSDEITSRELHIPDTEGLLELLKKLDVLKGENHIFIFEQDEQFFRQHSLGNRVIDDLFLYELMKLHDYLPDDQKIWDQYFKVFDLYRKRDKAIKKTIQAARVLHQKISAVVKQITSTKYQHLFMGPLSDFESIHNQMYMTPLVSEKDWFDFPKIKSFD